MTLAALLAIVFVGAGLVAWAFPDRAVDPVDRGLRICIGAALGLGTWSAGYAAARMLGIAPVIKDVALALAGAATFFLPRRKPPSVPSPSEPAPRWLWGLLFGGIAVALVSFFEHAWRFPDGGWDAWMIWNLRARFLVRAEDLRTVFSRNLLFWTHPDYPWLVPGAVAQGFLLAGRETPAVPEAIGAIFGVLAAAAVALALARLHGVRWGIIGGLAIVTIPAFAIFVANQQSDVPLGLYFGCAASLIALARPDGSARLLALAGFSAGLGAWTKNEGALYAAALGAGLLLRTRGVRAPLAFLLGALPAAALLIGFKRAYAPPNDLIQFSTAATLLGHALDARRWAELLSLSLRRVALFQVFGLWLVAEILVLVLWIRKLPATALGTALFLVTAAYALIYVVQPHPLEWVVRTSLNRIVIQLWPAAVLATSLALARTTART